MKKYFLILLTILLLFITGCEVVNNQKQYELDLTQISEEMYVNEFDVSMIKIKEIDTNGTINYIDCNESMFTAADYALLKTPGKHTVTVIYKLFRQDITITLLDVTNITGQLKVYFINVGQADCLLIILPNGKTIMIDAGLDHATIYGENNFPSWNNIVTILTLENIKQIDYFLITHNHADHYYYATNIISGYNVQGVYMSGTTSTNTAYKNILSTINKLNIPLFEVSMGEKIIDEDGILFQVVSTQKLNNPSDTNKCSVVTKLTYGENSFLFMGDAGTKSSNEDGITDGEYIALNGNIDLKADVLKVGHHGTSYGSSKEFLKKVQPEYSVITTSNITSTGHPHSSCLSRLITYSRFVLQSKNDGTILFISDGKTLESFTHIGE